MKWYGFRKKNIGPEPIENRFEFATARDDFALEIDRIENKQKI